MIEEMVDGRNQRKEQYMYPEKENFAPGTHRVVNGKRLEKHTDIIGGHARIGTGDHIFSSSSMPPGRVRYIVFLRNPTERYVSGVLYQNKVWGRNETLDQVVSKIKNSIVNKREKDEYWNKSLSYLFTPDQRVQNKHFDVEELRKTVILNPTIPSTSFAAETRSKLVIQNLYAYNAIIGLTERMAGSLNILKHVLLNEPDEALKKKAEDVFKKFSPSESNVDGNYSATFEVEGGVHANKSSKREVPTSAVIAELVKDEEHMLLFEEYVKYERMITDFAWTMHDLQYDAVVRTTR